MLDWIQMGLLVTALITIVVSLQIVSASNLIPDLG